MHINWVHILFAAWFAIGIVLMLVFHFTTRDARPVPAPELKPAKLIPKNEVWSQPAYDYNHTASPDRAVTPIEPGDGDLPPDDPPPDS